MIHPLLRNIEIVGNHFREEMEKETFMALTLTDKVTLELEPTNPHDAFAVKVNAGGAHIGYIPKIASAIFHTMGTDVVKTLVCEITEATKQKRCVSIGFKADN